MGNRKKILMAVPSEIIFLGIQRILEVPGKDLFRVGSLDELARFNTSENIDIVLIDPSLIQHNLVLFNKIATEFEGAKWLGMVFSYFEKNVLEQFDDIIQIGDRPETIKRKIGKLLESGNSQESHIRNTLSEREIEVLKLLVQGNATKEIADKLFISTHTVITHRKNISQKTGIKSVSGLTIYAVVNKIIALDGYSG
ncbi:MAG: helix-turn-helix transcriptional regulator [Chlorobi bacterium]|nr:helix-turn-helix transcriptional regulator [Chlorobiota bacterium]